MKNISFIGLGNMGFEMAINLSKSGYNVTGFDIHQEKYKQLEEKNVKCVSSIVETLNNPDFAPWRSIMLDSRSILSCKTASLPLTGVTSLIATYDI